MKSTPLIVSIAMLAVTISTTLLAGDREQDHERDGQPTAEMRTTGGFDHGMKAVTNSAVPAAPGYGWRYFSDPAARRAVVISPQGDYYYSHGKGLHWIAAEQS